MCYVCECVIPELYWGLFHLIIAYQFYFITVNFHFIQCQTDFMVKLAIYSNTWPDHRALAMCLGDLSLITGQLELNTNLVIPNASN